jgi:hypothetical protein
MVVVDSRSHADFARRVAALFRAMDAKVFLDVVAGGAEVDLLIEDLAPSGDRTVTVVDLRAGVQPVNSSAVNQFASTLRALRTAMHVDRAVMVTAARYMESARPIATHAKIELLTIDELEREVWLRKEAGLERALDSLGPVLTSGTAVLVAGSELPAVRAAPTTVEVLIRVVESHYRGTDSPFRISLLRGLDNGQLSSVASALRADGVRLEEEISRAYGGEQQPREGYEALARTPFASVVNLTWDRQLVTSFVDRAPWELRAGSNEVLDAAKSNDFAFTWLAGDPETELVSVGMKEVRGRLYSDETLSRFLATLVEGSPLLFVGCRAAEVVEFFDAVVPFAPPSSSGGPLPARFAICPIDELWELHTAQLEVDYGVELLGYDADVPGALARLLQALADRSVAGPSVTRRSASPALTRVILQNIGAFERLEVELSDAWNLLLGNNGCGKTTVLRAVALGLCGDHPQAVEAGASLLRAGTKQGSIELEVGQTRYRTELVRSKSAVRVRTTSLTPLQQGNWAVLGFPALRGMSVLQASGFANPQTPEPRVEDLLPLLKGEVDHRMDDIKQWIINLYARVKDRDGERWLDLLNRFFGVVQELTPGGVLRFDHVDHVSWDVLVRTDDGIVSIDQLSQGMSSIIAWVGCLLQRMYDIFPNSHDPAQEPAFVLIDELDAHLHPTWQRLLPTLTRKHFPNVQFLATSHSPLVASSLGASELFVARRVSAEESPNERLVATIERVDIDPKGLRADQILTSPLFGMMTSRSPDFAQDVARYTHLMTNDSRTAAEDVEMARLGDQISASYRDGETAIERAEQGFASAPDDQAWLGTLDPDQLAAIRDFVELEAEPTRDEPWPGEGATS